MASRMQFTSEARSVRRLVFVALVVGLVATALPVGATLAPSTFNAFDGNLDATKPGGTDAQDWFNAPSFTTTPDDGTGQGDSSMGNGTKEDTPVPSLGTGGIPNNKSDLARFYTGKDTVAGNKNFLYLAWVRNNTLGTANMDFEFNQHFCTPNATPADTDCSANGLTPNRAAGDMLITFDFAGGGKTVDLSVLRWLTTTGTCEAGGYPCWGNKLDLDAFNYGEGAVNDGFTVTDPRAGNVTLEDKTFGEASINLTDASVLPQPATSSDCVSFGSAYLKSRSSDSFTAAMKDYIKPEPVSVSNCATISVNKTISGTTTTLGGAKFKLYKDDGDNTAEIGTGGQDLPALFIAGSTTVTECETTGPSGTNPGTGNCTWRVTSTGRYWLEETARPTGYQFMSPNPKSIDIASLGGNHPQAIGNLPQPRDIAITKSDDTTNGRVNGAVFALYNDAATVGTFDTSDTALSGKTCTTTGQGTCKITGIDPGDYWVLETTVPAGYAADPAASSCTVSSVAYKCRQVNVPGDGATTDIAVGFANPRQFKIVTFVCNEVSGTLYRSTVSLSGGTAKTTLDEVPGVSASQICDLTASQGATFGGQTASATAKALSVTIPVTEAAAPSPSPSPSPSPTP